MYIHVKVCDFGKPTNTVTTAQKLKEFCVKKPEVQKELAKPLYLLITCPFSSQSLFHFNLHVLNTDSASLFGSFINYFLVLKKKNTIKFWKISRV